MGAQVSLWRGRPLERPVLEQHLHGPLGCWNCLPSIARRRCIHVLAGTTEPESHSEQALLSPIGSLPSSAALSFKSSRPRKTKDFIGSARQNERREYGQEDSDVGIDTIIEKVAAMVFQHVQEGDKQIAASNGARNPASDEFQDSHFTCRSCCSRCWPSQRPGAVPIPSVSEHNIFTFIADFSTSLYFCKQVLVFSAVYIDKLLRASNAALTSGNWRSIVVATMMVASKVWEDVHPWNADFRDCLRDIASMRYQSGGLYRLESLFLERIRWAVFVDSDTYAAYYFALVGTGIEIDSNGSGRKPSRERHYTDGAIATIAEDEPAGANSDSDFERGIFPEAISCIGSSSASSSSSALPMQVPWSRGELMSNWRKCALAGGDICGMALRAKREVWKLDARNPHIGALRHAPKAPVPNKHLPQSQLLLWESRMASCSAEVFGPRHTVPGFVAASTISGATGSQLAAELRRYLDGHHADTEARHNPAAIQSLRSAFANQGTDPTVG